MRAPASAAEPRRETTGRFVAPLVVAAFLLAFGGLHYGFYTRKLLLDTPIYERYGDAMVHAHRLPYRDFAVEYPPGALPAFALPSLVAPAGDFERYRQAFEALMLACGAAGAALAGSVLARQRASRPRLAAGTLLAGLAPLALGPVVLSRFDLWPAALTVAAVAALVAGRKRAAFALLALAVVAKAYAAVLLPLAFVYVLRRYGRREALACAAALLGVAAAVVAPFAALAPHGVWASVSGQAERPLQIESLGASFLLAAHQLWSLPLVEAASHGSDNLVGAAPHALATAQSAAGIVVMLALWVGFARGPADRDRLLRYAAASVCAFVALDKVLSPQYLIWLMALVPLVRGRRGAVAAALFVAALVLTQLWFPHRYIDLVYGFDPRASWLVLARDLTLLALLITLAWPEGVRRRAGALIVAATVALAASAAGMAAVSGGATSVGPTHSGLLVESGIAGSCARPRPAPPAGSGSVRYDASSFPGPGRSAACVTVTLRTSPHAQVFSAAYLGRFDDTDPRAHYLADSGTCTNVAGGAGGRLRYSFRVPAGSRFVVEAESCSSGTAALPYAVAVAVGGGAPAAPADVSARRARGGAVVVRWRTGGEATGTRTAVYREQDGLRIRVGVATGAGRAHALRDPRPPTAVPYRYWLRATAAGGGSTWVGPIPVSGG